MRKLINLIALLIMASSVTWAQDKKSFTLEDLMPGGNNYYNLLPQNLYGLQWWGDVCINADIEEVKTIHPANGKENVLITLQEVNELLANKKLGKINHFRNVSFPYAEKMMLVNTTSNKVLIDLTKKEIIWSQPLSPKAANQDWNKESRSLAYTLDNNLFVTTADGKTQQVTDEPKGIVCGQSVHRQEFGISKGTFWSPKGNLLAFYRMDESMVTDYPQVNTSTRIATLEPDKYPMAGMTSHKVTVGIYNPATQKTVYLKAGDPTDRYFTNISWSPDEKSVYVIELNRDQNHALLCCYDAETGEPLKNNPLYEEEHTKYVEPQHPIVFLPWDHTKFIYQSQRDGYNHLYLMDTKTSIYPESHGAAAGGSYRESYKTRQLTQGNWVVQNILGFNEKTKEVIIMSTEVSPLQSNAYAVNVKTGKRRLIGNKDGMHHVQLSGSGNYVIDNYTSFTIPRNIEIVPTSGKEKTVSLLTATNPMEAYNIPEITVGTLKAADGKTDLYYRLVKPADFDPNKKYPMLVYYYGGTTPTTRGISNPYCAQLFASRDYVVYVIQPSGTIGFGQEFSARHVNAWGKRTADDIIEGTKQFCKEHRIGCLGASYGGFMTQYLQTQTDIFAAAVSHAGISDVTSYWGEGYWGYSYNAIAAADSYPWKNPDLFTKQGSLFNADKINTPLLLLHGTVDTNR